MATHRISLIESQTPGPFDIYYRLQNEFNFTLFIVDVYDVDLGNGLCVTLPDNAVEIKIINKHLNANTEVIHQIPI